MTSRELVLATLEFRNSERIPRQMWLLPWAKNHHPAEVEKIPKDFPDDIIQVQPIYDVNPITIGNPYEIGQYVDEWGCIFENRVQGIIGEVKEPLVCAADEDWKDTNKVHIPEELITFDMERVNAFCRSTDKFVLAGVCPRPFEQLQFIRGTEQLYMDLMDIPPNMMKFIEKMHDFYCRLLTRWTQSEVDALVFMDDWGSQINLLINPTIWIKIFKPLYRDYVQIAHQYNKKIFMHSARWSDNRK